MVVSTTRDVRDEEEDEPCNPYRTDQARQPQHHHHDDDDDDDQDDDADFVPNQQHSDSDAEFDADHDVPEIDTTSGENIINKKRRKTSDNAADNRHTALPDDDVRDEPKRSTVDDLWAEMNATPASSKRAPASAASSSFASLVGTVTPRPGAGSTKPAASASSTSGGAAGSGGSSIDIKALLRKTQGAVTSGASPAPPPDSVTITQRLDFCGEEIVVTKQVKKGSKEEELYLEEQKSARKVTLAEKSGSTGPAAGQSLANVVAASTQLQREMASSAAAGAAAGALAPAADGLEFKPALPAPKLPAPKPTGLQSLLASIDGGKKKMTTTEKSRHDWEKFKSTQDEQTRADMEKFAKDGYLEKQAFLMRTDARQADVARTNRRRGMGMRD